MKHEIHAIKYLTARIRVLLHENVTSLNENNFKSKRNNNINKPIFQRVKTERNNSADDDDDIVDNEDI